MYYRIIALLLCCAFLFPACEKRKDFDKDACVSLLFPHTYLAPDGTEIVLDYENDSDLKDWFNANEDAEEKPALQYPVNIKHTDGEIQTVGSEDELIAIKEEVCE